VYCWNCGAELPDVANFCPECGVSVTESAQEQGYPDQYVEPDAASENNSIKNFLGLIFGTVIALILIGIFLPATVGSLIGYIPTLVAAEDPPTNDYYSYSKPTLAPEKPTVVPTTQSPTPTFTPHSTTTPYPTFTIYRTPTPRPTPTPSPKPTDSADYYYRSYQWRYLDTDWFYTMGVSKDAYQYYRNKPHNRESDYAQYALSDYDRQYMKSTVDRFQEVSREGGYSEYDTIMNIVSFVQSLPYTSDSVTTGYDEYPRYPLETLVDNGGDCEDTAILTAALIQEMGYGAVLIEFPEHMAVGVKCDDSFYGTYYEYHGSRYYYLETTGDDWEIGELPPEYERYSSATIHPMIQVPRMDMSVTTEVEDYNAYYVYYRIHCDIENIGSGTALNPVVYISALAPTEGSGLVWDQEAVELDDYQEGATGWAEATVSIPRDTVSQIHCILYGSNFESVEIESSTFST
jgi:predicted transglutaminase-like cysteine proteinase